VYLVDTDVISEALKGDKANAGVRAFFKNAARDNTALYLSAITVGELRQGVERIHEELHVDRLSSVAAFSPYHFHRQFRQLFGVSVMK
jgi:toxin FitB